MNITNIDEDFVDIIKYLDENGFRPFSSCDGVLSHHSENNAPTTAYIAFLKSDRILDLIHAFFKNKKFSVSISTSQESYAQELYGNIIDGTQYAVYSQNQNGEMSNDFQRIIRETIEGKETGIDKEMKMLKVIEYALEEDNGESELGFDITLNSSYQPYMNKEGNINTLVISTKENGQYVRDMRQMSKMIAEKYGIKLKSSDLTETFDEGTEFIVPEFDSMSTCIYFEDDNLPRIIDMMRYSRNIQDTLSKIERKEEEYLGCDADGAGESIDESDGYEY